MVYKARHITTVLSYSRFVKEERWEKFDVDFDEYKLSIKRHLGNTNFNRNTNKYKHVIKQKVNHAKNIDDIIKAFDCTGIKIDIKCVI